VNAVKAAFPRFDYQWLAEEVNDNLPRELDFRCEADNARRCAANFAHRRDVVVPRIFAPLSSARVLVMSFEEGCYANKVDVIRRQGIEPAAVARLVSEVFSEQIFVHGYCHCDPHAANLLIRRMPGSRAPQLVLLDHGLYRTLPPQLRLNYAKMWRAIIMGDIPGIRRYAARMNAGDMAELFASMLTTRSWDTLLAAGEGGDLNKLRFSGTAQDKAETKDYARQYAAEIGDVLRKIPRELLLILKTNDCLRAVDLALGAPVNNFVTVGRYTQAALNAERLEERPGLRSRVAVTVDTLRMEARLRAFEWAVTLARATVAVQAWTRGWWGRAPASAVAAAPPAPAPTQQLQRPAISASIV
jgi:aarF domain-containing kinase